MKINLNSYVGIIYNLYIIIISIQIIKSPKYIRTHIATLIKNILFVCQDKVSVKRNLLKIIIFTKEYIMVVRNSSG